MDLEALCIWIMSSADQSFWVGWTEGSNESGAGCLDSLEDGTSNIVVANALICHWA
jgi:hypothetical protein